MTRSIRRASSGKAGGTDTHYRVFVGHGAGFDWILGGQIAGYTDGLSNTPMVATAAGAVPWTKPDELAFDPQKDMTRLLGPVNGVVQYAMFDGSERSRVKPPGKQSLHATITKAGGEVYSDDE